MRLFVAVWPPPAVVEMLTRLERPERPGVRWTTADQWHVTVWFLGEVADAEPVDRALELVRSSSGTAVAGPALRRFGRFVLALPVAGLDQVAVEVGRLTAGMGSASASASAGGAVDGLIQAFHGHLTVARGGRGVDLGSLDSVPLAASWPVEEVTLVVSRLHLQGARYEVVGRYPPAAGDARRSGTG